MLQYWMSWIQEYNLPVEIKGFARFYDPWQDLRSRKVLVGGGHRSQFLQHAVRPETSASRPLPPHSNTIYAMHKFTPDAKTEPQISFSQEHSQ